MNYYDKEKYREMVLAAAEAVLDSRNCYELIQRGFVVIPNNNKAGISNNKNNHEHIRTIEQIVSRDKGGMIISPQVGLHENVVALDYDSEYANLIVNRNLSYETVTLEEGGEVVVQQQQPSKKKGLLPTVGPQSSSYYGKVCRYQ